MREEFGTLSCVGLLGVRFSDHAATREDNPKELRRRTSRIRPQPLMRVFHMILSRRIGRVVAHRSDQNLLVACAIRTMSIIGGIPYVRWRGHLTPGATMGCRRAAFARRCRQSSRVPVMFKLPSQRGAHIPSAPRLQILGQCMEEYPL